MKKTNQTKKNKLLKRKKERREKQPTAAFVVRSFRLLADIELENFILFLCSDLFNPFSFRICPHASIIWESITP